MVHPKSLPQTIFPQKKRSCVLCFSAMIWHRTHFSWRYRLILFFRYFNLSSSIFAAIPRFFFFSVFPYRLLFPNGTVYAAVHAAIHAPAFFWYLHAFSASRINSCKKKSKILMEILLTIDRLTDMVIIQRWWKMYLNDLLTEKKYPNIVLLRKAAFPKLL